MRIYLSRHCLDVKLSTRKPKHPRLLRHFFYGGYSRKSKNLYACREISKCQITQSWRLKFSLASYIGCGPQIEQNNVNILGNEEQ